MFMWVSTTGDALKREGLILPLRLPFCAVPVATCA
jgi:hypothetical protein